MRPVYTRFASTLHVTEAASRHLRPKIANPKKTRCRGESRQLLVAISARNRYSTRSHDSALLLSPGKPGAVDLDPPVQKTEIAFEQFFATKRVLSNSRELEVKRAHTIESPRSLRNVRTLPVSGTQKRLRRYIELGREKVIHYMPLLALCGTQADGSFWRIDGVDELRSFQCTNE